MGHRASDPRTAYRPSPPSADALVAWPDAFGTRFTLFVDTEEEFDWSKPFARDGYTTRAIAALPGAHERFAAHGIAPTYLVDYPVAADPDAIETIAALCRDGRGAVGAQLHPWVNPPFAEGTTRRESYVGNLPPDLEAAKLRALTEAIAHAFGAPPRAYRAGRYGIGPATSAILASLGYRLDTSIRARYDYSADGGPDFTRIGAAAWHTPEGLVSLPFTTVFTGVARALGPALDPFAARVPYGRGVLARSGVLARVSLTPEGMPVADALEAIRVALGEGVRVLNFAFHSPSLIAGNTPFVRDAAALATFWRWWDAVLDLLARRGVAPASLDDVLAASG